MDITIHFADVMKLELPFNLSPFIVFTDEDLVGRTIRPPPAPARQPVNPEANAAGSLK